MPDAGLSRRTRALRGGLRVAIVLLLSAALVSLAALSGEYPGDSAAGRGVVLREVLPLAALGWVNLIVLEDATTSAGRRWWAVIAMIGDAVFLASAVARGWRGGPPLTVVMPPIAAVLLVCSVGVGWRLRGAAGGSRGGS